MCGRNVCLLPFGSQSASSLFPSFFFLIFLLLLDDIFHESGPSLSSVSLFYNDALEDYGTQVFFLSFSSSSPQKLTVSMSPEVQKMCSFVMLSVCRYKTKRNHNKRHLALMNDSLKIKRVVIFSCFGGWSFSR